MPKEFQVLIDKTYLFKVECKNNYTSIFDNHLDLKKCAWIKKLLKALMMLNLSLW